MRKDFDLSWNETFELLMSTSQRHPVFSLIQGESSSVTFKNSRQPFMSELFPGNDREWKPGR